MFKFGLEKEAFIELKDKPGELVLVPQTVSYDACGWLIEARGEPYYDFTNAVYSLAAAMDKLLRKLNNLGYNVLDVPVLRVPKELRHSASRTFVKGLTHYHNLYGFSNHRIKGEEATAGIHISVTNETSFSYEVRTKCPSGKGYHTENKSKVYNPIWDWARLFRFLDIVFEDQIRKAKRNPGFYEIKDDGRIEYRSLPSNIPIGDLINGWERAWKAFEKGEEKP